MARLALILLLASLSVRAGSFYMSDSQRFDISPQFKSVTITDADGAATQYTLALYLPDISGREEFIAYVFSAVDGSDQAVTIRKYYSGKLDFMEFIGDNMTLSGDLYLEQE